MIRRLMRHAIPAALFAAAAAPSLAQDTGPQPEADPEPAFQPWAPAWTDGEIAEIAGRLTGRYVSGGDDAVVVDIRPVPVDGLDDTFLMEVARADNPAFPFRFTFAQLLRHGGTLKLRLYDALYLDLQAQGVLTAIGYAPEAMPDIDSSRFVPTAELDLTQTAGGFRARTPGLVPSNTAGCAYITSSITLDGDTLVIDDRGFDVSDSLVWGEPGGTAFTRTSPLGVEKRDNGLIIIDYVRGDGEPVQDGDTVFANYAGWSQPGILFDSTYAEGREPMRFIYPGRLIQGWNETLPGITEQTTVRIIIPSDLGYGSRGAAQGKIPPDSTLYFNMEIVAFQRAPEPAPGADAETEDQPANGDQ